MAIVGRACARLGRRPNNNTMPVASPPSLGRVHAALAPARERLAARDGAIIRAQIAVSQIAAPTGHERRRGAWVARRFAALGLRDVRTDEAGNVIGWRGPESDIAPVVVCAHLDTVFPGDTTLRVRRDGARLVGPGIGDNGRGLVAMLAIAEELDGSFVRTERPVQFVATTGEEGAGDLRGAKHLFGTTAGPDPVAVIALDGAGDERVVHRALGSRRYRIAFEGPGGHSWAAYGVPNAVHAAGIATARLASLALTRSPRTTLSVCRIGGGISVNAIPRDAWIEVDLRSTSASTIARLDREIRMVAYIAAEEENARRAHATPQLRCTVSVIGDRPCGETAPEHPLVRAALEATRCIGREPELTVASTDANVPISRGIPAIAIGAGGRGGEAHTPDEWFDNTDGTLGIARAMTIVAAAAGLGGP
jgi:acetylornithine deacetylase/succinyl-diaminopimelate desuccinylase-like protein